MEKIWLPDCKFWSPTYFIYTCNSHKNTNMILYASLHTRKVTNDKPKLLKTARVVVLRSGPKVMVFFEVILNREKYKNF